MKKKLIECLYHKHNKKVVVLIDECDNPILEPLYYSNREVARSNLNLVNQFFSILITNPQYNIRLFYITGLSRYFKADKFLGLDKTTDISLDPDYSTICGFTESELKAVFAYELATVEKVSFDKIKRKYYEYSSPSKEKDQEKRAKNRIYNPFSIVVSIAQKGFTLGGIYPLILRLRIQMRKFLNTYFPLKISVKL